ncbi:uncharacterized protein LOC143629326 [Bidens hawaiensis]|uniref:uncharacterized protein LOC143629326 n=1 Tax=Bidens hawaiensis TaxID=980011 RepID=UPI0040498183
MNLKHLLSRLTINNASKLNHRIRTVRNYTLICTNRCISSGFQNPKSQIPFPNPIPHLGSNRFFQSSHQTVSNGAESVNVSSEEDDEAVMNEFLSRFVWIMRGKLTAVYTEADKTEINAMLQIIVEKVVSEMEGDNLEHFIGADAGSVSGDFSEDLWTTVREVSGVVLEDMKKAKKKEKMKGFLQSEEVKEMTRFAGEIGIRGDMLRELRFKWAREKLEDSEFYESLARMRKDAVEPEVESRTGEGFDGDNKTEGEDDDGIVSLPKRSGKIKYNIYGLDLLKPKWAEVAEQIQEAGGSVWSEEPKPITGKCKMVTEKIMSLQADEDPSALIAEWIELLQPSRVDWVALLDKLKEQNHQMYIKVAELILDETSFQAHVRDYSQLVDAHAKNNQLPEAERIIEKMKKNGITPDILTKATMVHMYSKSGNLDLAKEEFESLKAEGFKPDVKVYSSMIMAYINAGDPKTAESLLKGLNSNVKPSEDLFLALIKSYSQIGDPGSAGRVVNMMEFAGYQQGLESNACLVEAYSRSQTDGVYDARKHFDEIIKLGFKPDDKCVANMISAYAKKNWLDKALELLIELEKDGTEPGLETYSVLIAWLSKLQLMDEAEDLLLKFSEKGVSPSLNVRVSLLDMYVQAREEKKTLQTLTVIEANKDKLTHGEFEKVIELLLKGGFRQDAERMLGLMTARGFKASDHLTLNLTFRGNTSSFCRNRLSMK